MASGFFSKMFGKKVDLDSIRAEIHRIEHELGQKFDAKAFQNGEWFLEYFERFVQRYQNHDRIRALEAAHPDLDENQLADRLIEDAVRTATIAGGTGGAIVSAAELSGIFTGLIGLSMGVASAVAQMIYLVNLQLQLTFDIASINNVTASIDDPEEMLVSFASSLGMNMLDLRGENLSEFAILAKSAGRFHLFKRLSTEVGKMLVRQLTTKYAVPMIAIGLGAYFDRNRTSKVGEGAKKRFGRLRVMREKLFDLHPRIAHQETDVLLAAFGYLHSDGLLTLEEIYLLRDLARSMQASAVWQKIMIQEIVFDSKVFIQKFRNPANFEQREALLSMLKILSEAKMQPNEQEAEFLRKLIN